MGTTYSSSPFPPPLIPNTEPVERGLTQTDTTSFPSLPSPCVNEVVVLPAAGFVGMSASGRENVQSLAVRTVRPAAEAGRSTLHPIGAEQL